jgi:hypothetical protein
MTKLIKICAFCHKNLVELNEDADPEQNWICDDCYMLLLEPDYEEGEGYNQ